MTTEERLNEALGLLAAYRRALGELVETDPNSVLGAPLPTEAARLLRLYRARAEARASHTTAAPLH